LESIISKYAKKALRTIAFGYKDLKKMKEEQTMKTDQLAQRFMKLKKVVLP
jgi:magnesium-transporting ATPase (P-type)